MAIEIESRSKHIVNSTVSFVGNERKYVNDALDSGWISSQGKYVLLLEKYFAEYLGVKYAISVANGTCALQVALLALGIKPGDEVIVPDLTFAATANAVLHIGATPVLVDSSPEHFGIDPEQIKKAITKKTRAIIPVHLYGEPCNMSEILNIANTHGLHVVEDNAEALGATVLGKKAGALGSVGCFSLYANKIITSGEGGMCVTNDEAIANRIVMLRDHGMRKTKRYWHECIGYNFRMTNLSAAIGLAQLEKIQIILEKRKQIFEYYKHYLQGVRGIQMQLPTSFGERIHWVFYIRILEETGISRDAVLNFLMENNIEARIAFYPIHMMPPYQTMKTSYAHLWNSDKFGLNGICLPLYPSLTIEDIQYICKIVKLALIV